MTDEQIAKVYTEGNNISHTAALRAVYDAGYRHDETEAERLRLLEQGLVSTAPTMAEIAEVRAVASAKAVAANKSLADQRLAQDMAEDYLVKARA